VYILVNNLNFNIVLDAEIIQYSTYCNTSITFHFWLDHFRLLQEKLEELESRLPAQPSYPEIKFRSRCLALSIFRRCFIVRSSRYIVGGGGGGYP
jgi:hypothetical protein